MKNKLLFCFIFITIIFLSGCTTSEPAVEENAVSDHSNNEKISTDNDVFSIELNKTLISLKDRENEIDLESLLGEPISQNIEL